MYIHIGGEATVPEDEISAIINLETVLPSQKSVTDFINGTDDANKLEYLTADIPKTLIITSDRTYVSSLSVSVLLNRIENASDYINID